MAITIPIKLYLMIYLPGATSRTDEQLYKGSLKVLGPDRIVLTVVIPSNTLSEKERQ